ncbi:haloalkane dehalogenase [Lentzea sp. CA-135723]|uniref:haloalkane dehalogenase n=1 Tax=Lentzea sp. CA-135723 TaxID=3239950 RepID=UPI003D8AFA2C
MIKTDVLGSWIAHAESGEGPAVVFLHGNPTSSYLWRDVLPHVGGVRCLVPDLIGVGESGKPAIEYRFDEQARYLAAWLDAVVPGEVVLVGHDWGGALAQDWAARGGSARLRGLALIETFLRPVPSAELDPRAVEMFRAVREPGVGEQMILQDNVLIDRNFRRLVPGMSEEDLDVYRAAYPEPEARRAILAWAREFPLDGEPARVAARIDAYGRWMRDSGDVPKLLMTVSPATGLGSPEAVAWARDNVSALRIEDVGESGHQAPEQVPAAIGRAVARWLEGLR